MVGETFNPPGNWSSYPPHKHDGRDGEPVLEEVYYYRVDPAHGFGQQMLYTEDGECVTHTVRDGDAVLLPYGYHPVSAPPGYQLYYLWGLAGAERKIALHALARSYTGAQRLSYVLVVFVLGPIVLLSGLAFSPMLASVSPALVSVFGGQQSARTIHFFAAAAVVGFLIGHVVMVAASGFTTHMRSMIVGDQRSSMEET